MAYIIHQLFASYVLMAEQIDSMICTSLEQKKPFVFVVRVFFACYFVESYSSSPMPYAEI